MPLDKEKICIYQVNAEKGIKCECSECKNCKHYKEVKKMKNIAKAIDKLRNIIAELREEDFGIWGNEAIREETNAMLTQVSIIENENK